MKVYLLVLPLLLVACATPFSDDRFPTREALLDLAQQPAPTMEKRTDPVSVPEWELKGPFPDRFAEHLPATGAAGTFLEEIAPGRSSEGLSCMARELGRFVLAKKERPEPLLEEFMLGRCGNSVTSVAYSSVQGEAREGDDERALLAHVKEDMVAWMRDADDGTRFGVAAVRGEGNKMIAIAVRAVPQTTIETTTQIAADGKIEVSGTVVRNDGPLVATLALVTKGTLGVEKCTPEPLMLPKFSFSCPVADDDTATIAIATWERGRVLGHTLAQLTVLPRGGPGNVFKRVAYMDPKPIPDAGAIGPALIDAANALRAGAGMPPLVQAKAQDVIGAQLVGRYFASREDDERLLDTIALGLLAGWEVNEITIGDGDFNSFTMYGEGLHDLMAAALAAPSTRAQLMKPESSVASIAITPIGRGYGALLSTYEPLVTPTTEMATGVFESLRAARRARGVSDLMILPVGDAEKRAVLAVYDGKEPEQALKTALNEAVEVRGSALHGYVVRAQDLERIDWPEELLTPKQTSVAIAIGAYKHKDAAWGSLIMFVIAEIDDPRYASTQ